MGSQQCVTCHEDNVSSSAYGYFELVIEDHKQMALMRKTIPSGAIDRMQMVRQLAKRKRINHANLVKLHSYHVDVDHYLLNIELKYEYIPMTLRQKNAQWANDHRVSEIEVANLILGVENAIVELHKIGIPHRLINLDTILCEKALYKLADSSMVTFLTGLDLARQGDQGQFLSQKNLVVLNNEGTRPDYELQDDLFSLGLVVLVVILRCKPKDLYRRSLDKIHLNHQRINLGLKVLDEHYDAWMGKKVRELLTTSLKQSTATSQDSPCKPSICTACKNPY